MERRSELDTAPASNVQLFVVHAPEDAWFVEGFLLKALDLPEEQVLVSSKLDPGAGVVHEIERGVLSPVTVVVVSSAFLTSRWAQFSHQLAMHQSIEAANDGSATLIPAILVDCELPLLSRYRVPLDFRNRDRVHWEAEAAKLRKKFAQHAPATAPIRPVPCPYPGIRPFTRTDAEHFHGRDEEISKLLGWLRDERRELYVIGPSGSGKSSLVAAGLLPSLCRSPKLAGGSFLVRQMRPGAEPLIALAKALEATAAEVRAAAMPSLDDAVGQLLATQPGHGRLLIFVDQLEELFTIARADRRASFIAAVRMLRGDTRVVLVLTLRADFYAALMESELWADLEGDPWRLDVSPLRGNKLRRAIEVPARKLGVYFEPVLIERLLHDVADEPGALPLLQDTLLELWHQPTRGLLRLSEYEAMEEKGHTGLAAMVARRANGALNDLSPGQRQIARRVLLRLVHFGDGTATTRRQQPRSALSTVSDASEDIDAVIRHLVDRRLITTSSGDNMTAAVRIDLAHEILLSAWPALAESIHTRKDDEQRRRVLEAKAAEWMECGRGQSRLLDADELREAQALLSDEKMRDLGVSEAIQSLLIESKNAFDKQLAEAEGRRRRWRRWVTAALIVLTGAVVAVSRMAVVAQHQSRETRLQLARNYVSQGRALLVSGHPEEAAPYLLAAREAGIYDEELGKLFRWAVQGLPLVRLVQRADIRAVAWSPEGERLVTASADGTTQIWSINGDYALKQGTLNHQSEITAVAWNSDGTEVATASLDETARLWDARNGTEITRFKHLGAVTVVVWSPDGTKIATASADRTARVWDVGKRTEIAQFKHLGVINAVAWSPDGTKIATASVDRTARVWDVDKGTEVALLEHPGEVKAVSWSPKETRVVTVSVDAIARVWDLNNKKATPLRLEHQGGVKAAVWSPDGKSLATASADGTARVWDAQSGKALTPPLKHQGEVNALAWSPDGERIATASRDQTARVWDARNGVEVTPPLEHLGEVNAVTWSPKGALVATASSDHTARVWDVGAEKSPTTKLRHNGPVWAAAWSPDGKRVVTASGDQTAQVWDAHTGQPMLRPLKHQSVVDGVAWSPDGKQIATVSVDRTAWVWDADKGTLLTPPLEHQSRVQGVEWSPDETRLVTRSADGTARVWNLKIGKPVTPRLSYVYGVKWSPDGVGVAIESLDGVTRVWDTTNGQPLTPPLAYVWLVMGEVHEGSVATWALDGTERYWNARGMTPAPIRLAGFLSSRSSSDESRRTGATAGELMVTADADERKLVLDAVSGQPVSLPLEHRNFSPPPPFNGALIGGVPSSAWSPNPGSPLVLSRMRQGRHASVQLEMPPFAHEDGVTTIEQSPDGTHVATASVDGTVRIWDVSLATGTITDWRSILDRCDYYLNDEGQLVPRLTPSR